MDDADLLRGMDDIAKMVAGYTGIRQQFLDSGWSRENAELMVIEVLRLWQRV